MLCADQVLLPALSRVRFRQRSPRCGAARSIGTARAMCGSFMISKNHVVHPGSARQPVCASAHACMPEAARRAPLSGDVTSGRRRLARAPLMLFPTAFIGLRVPRVCSSPHRRREARRRIRSRLPFTWRRSSRAPSSLAEMRLVHGSRARIRSVAAVRVSGPDRLRAHGETKRPGNGAERVARDVEGALSLRFDRMRRGEHPRQHHPVCRQRVEASLRRVEVEVHQRAVVLAPRPISTAGRRLARGSSEDCLG